MKTVNLQVPMSKELRLSAQEAVRMFLNKLASRTIYAVFSPKTIKLSPKAIKRYNKIAEEIERGEGIYRTESVDDLMKQLKS